MLFVSRYVVGASKGHIFQSPFVRPSELKGVFEIPTNQKAGSHPDLGVLKQSLAGFLY